VVGSETIFSFSILVSLTVFLYTLIMIFKLQGLDKLGELIIMVNFMFSELKQFLITFGLIMLTFIIVGRQLNAEFKKE
jgi:hypothetical protein